MSIAPDPTSPPQLEFFLLGAPEILRRGVGAFKLTSAKAQALLYYLAMSGRAHTRVHLASLLWGDQTDEEALGRLRHELSALGEIKNRYLVVEQKSVAMRAESLYRVDAIDFAGAAVKANSGVVGDLNLLQHAATLFRGEFLEGFYVRHAQEFELWMLGQRTRLRALLIDLLATLARHAATRRELSAAIAYGRRILELEPWREEVHRQMMLWLAQNGEHAAALAQYEMLTQAVAGEFDVPPSDESAALYLAIQQGTIQAEIPYLVQNRPSTNEPVANGEPLANGMPAAPPLPSLLPQPLELPSRPDRLIGREAEVAGVITLLCRAEVGLVTLTGPGGVGKTRVALAVAARLRDQLQARLPAATDLFAGGVCFVDLAAVDDPDLVPTAIAQALNVREGADCTVEETLFESLRNQRLLLVLDNFEQVIPAVRFLAKLLDAAAGVKVLTTSRELLRLRQEYVRLLAPLALPNAHQLHDATHLRQIPAVELFVARALAVMPTLTLTSEEMATIAQICIRLDGLPLAIELAAARVNFLTLHTLLARLDRPMAILTEGARDLPVRQQTLRQTVDWSFHLLAPAEQRLFAHLAIFVGGFTLEAAEAVCTPENELPLAVLNGLQSLINKSLVRREAEARFSLLETLRQYAHEQLAASGEAEHLQERHAAYYLAFAQEASRHLFGREQHATLVRMDTEYGNLRMALQGCLARGQLLPALSLASALGSYWFQRGAIREGVGWLEQIIAQVRAAGYLDQHVLTEVYGTVLHHAGRLVSALRGDHEQSQLWHQEAFIVGKRINNLALQARSLVKLAQKASFRNEHATMHTLLAESLAIWRQLGDQQQMAATLNEMGAAVYRLQQLDQAEACFSEAAGLWRAAGNLRALSFALRNLSLVRCEQGQLLEAGALVEEGLKICEQVGAEARRDRLLDARGWIAYHMGDYRQAQSSHAEALALARRYEARTNIADSCYALAVSYSAQGCLPEAAHFYEQCLTGFITLRDKLKGLSGVAQLAMAQRQMGEALQLAAGVTAHLDQHELKLDAVARRLLAQVIEQGRSVLPAGAFDAVWVAGEQLDLEAMMQLALATARRFGAKQAHLLH